MVRKKKCKVFVSYSRHDEALVKPLAGLLGVASDDAVFLDVNSLKPGDDWEAEILGAVRDSSVFVVCWCCESEASPFVAKEISVALSKGRKRLVPVLFCSTPLPEQLKKQQWIDLRGRILHSCVSSHGNITTTKHQKTPEADRETRKDVSQGQAAIAEERLRTEHKSHIHGLFGGSRFRDIDSAAYKRGQRLGARRERPYEADLIALRAESYFKSLVDK